MDSGSSWMELRTSVLFDYMKKQIQRKKTDRTIVSFLWDVRKDQMKEIPMNSHQGENAVIWNQVDETKGERE